MPWISHKGFRAEVWLCWLYTAYQMLCSKEQSSCVSWIERGFRTSVCPLESSLTLQLFAKIEFLGDYKVFADLWPYFLDMRTCIWQLESTITKCHRLKHLKYLKQEKSYRSGSWKCKSKASETSFLALQVAILFKCPCCPLLFFIPVILCSNIVFNGPILS